MMTEEPIDNNNDINNDINNEINNHNKKNTIISFKKILEQLTLNLKVLGDIKNSDKLSIVNEQIEIDPYSYVRCIYRTYNRDSRSKSLEKVNELIEDIIQISNQLLNLEPFSSDIIDLPENNCKILQDLTPDMIHAIKGLNNLKNTYQNDVLTENKLEMLIKKTNDQVDKINSHMKVSLN